ncbi:multi-copper polyphenol oxidoreductase [Pasteurellaceae bacterium RH1A]|nr:multi-copper polyphenol oxidoreductase [Pasteurellaceae bacterium RH1A]
MLELIKPNWNVPGHVHALTTTRLGGVSLSPFDSLNLGNHVGDAPEAVAKNREILTACLKLPQVPLYLDQSHTTKVLHLPYTGTDLNADAAYTKQAKQVCLVMTADCQPVLFCNKEGNQVAAAHAGWRGLCDGVLEETAKAFDCPMEEIIVWVGPAIGENAFQVGQEVVEQFCAVDPEAIKAFRPDPRASGKFLGNLYQIAQQRLNKLGIQQISGGDYCTYTDTQRFFSYRKEGKTGRMATLIWFEDHA